jgi:hypothetical protein
MVATADPAGMQGNRLVFGQAPDGGIKPGTTSATLS